MHYLLILDNSKIYIKTKIKLLITCFGPRPSSGSFHLSLAKVTLMLKQSVKLRRYVLCGGVAACCVCVCTVCCALNIAAHSTHTIPGHTMLPHHRIIHNDAILPIVLT
jgi:hypothetical protein